MILEHISSVHLIEKLITDKNPEEFLFEKTNIIRMKILTK